MTPEQAQALVGRSFVPFKGNRCRFLAVAAGFLVSAAAHSSVLYVDSLADESAEGDGVSPETAFATLDAAAAAAADGDEIRILGGGGRSYVFASDTNGTRFAQAALRLVGWGDARPVLYPDPEVERTGGQRLFVLAGAGSSASRLAFHFTKASAGKATVLSVRAPDVAVRDCEFELVDGPATYQAGGYAGIVSCDRGCATNLLVEGCTFRNTRPASANWEYRPIMPRDGARIVGNLFTNVNAAVACRRLGASEKDGRADYTGAIAFVSNVVVESHCTAGGNYGGVILGNYNGPRTAEIAFNRFVNPGAEPSGAVVRKHREGCSSLSLHHNTVVGFQALLSTGDKWPGNTVAHVFDNLLLDTTAILREDAVDAKDSQGNVTETYLTSLKAGSYLRANATDGALYGGSAAEEDGYAAAVGAVLAVEPGPTLPEPPEFFHTRRPDDANYYRWRLPQGEFLVENAWTDGGAWPAYIGALPPLVKKPDPLVVIFGSKSFAPSGGGGSSPVQDEPVWPVVPPGDGWRVTALDPLHLVAQADFTPDEQAAFSLTPAELALSGWKFDNAFYAAADRATGGRAAREASLRAGPYAVSGHDVVSNGLWKTANGLLRFPDGRGHWKPARAARILYNVFLELDAPLQSGESVTLSMPDGENLSFTYDPDEPSPLFKVNQVGYDNDAPHRYAYLGGWMGPLGPVPAPSAATFELVDDATGAVALAGPLARRAADPTRDGTPFCGEETCEMDLSDAPAGRYFLRVAGVGRSEAFDIGPAGLGEAFALHMKGLYHQRCGCAKTADLTRWTDDACHLQVWRGVNPPDDWEYGSCFTAAPNGHVKVTHFEINSAMMDSYTESLSLPGGWHDAGDYDRRPMHMRIVGDFATVYLLRPGNFADSQLAVPERGNGIPDILDEAVWGLRHLLAGQQADGGVGTWIEGTRHPGDGDHCMPSEDPVRYCLSRATRQSTVEYAGYAALLARALEKAGGPAAAKMAAEFSKSAIRAWDYAAIAEPAKHVPMKAVAGKEIVDVFYDENENPPNPEAVAKAAVNLYALTGDARYAKALDDLVGPFQARINKSGYGLSPLVLAEFGFTDVPGEAFRKLADYWRERTIREADANLKRLENAYPYRLPWFGADEGWVHTMSWGNVHPLRQALKFVAAHALTGDRKYLDAAFLANDFHCGCNPNGSTWTAGLGTVYPVSYLSLASLEDGIGEYVAGITPYRNTFGLPPKAKEWVWRNRTDEIKLYPFLRRWADIENQTVAASEFTVWETIGPAAATTGYLMGPGLSPKNDMREPAADVHDLPGFWALP